MFTRNILLLVFMLLHTFYSNAQTDNELLLRYNKPAMYWEEALPMGNGQTGAMIFGGINQERIQLNDHTLWSGNPDPGNNAGAASLLPLIREQILTEQFERTEQTWRKMQGPYSARFLPLADLWLDFGHQDTQAVNYVRSLDIQQAINKTSYSLNGVDYERTVFVSHPAKALIIHLKANTKGKVSFKSKLTSKLRAQSHTNDKHLVLHGLAPTIVAHRSYFPQQVAYDEREGMEFEVRLAVKHKGGKLVVGEDFLQVNNADEVTLYLTESTSFNGFDHSPKKEGIDAVKAAREKMNHIYGKSLQKLMHDHVSDFRRLFDRVKFKIHCTKDKTNLFTDQRIKDFEQNPTDFQLQTLYFQYGRYLLLSSSRPGSRPANLQGIWNDHVQPPWGSNYTININTQMNYWLAESTNLSECHQPLLTFISELAVNGKETAQINYGIKEGWMAHHNADLWAKTSPVGHFEQDRTYYPGAFCWQMGGAWLSLHLWEHFQYTRDLSFLKEKGYPLMKGAAQFMLQWLVKDPESGFLVTAPSTSPENQFAFNDKKYSIGKATTMDISIVRELFSAVITASRELDMDQEFREEIEQASAKLYPFKIGRYGQLQEWSQDLDDPNDHHRHISHLFALYPGTQIPSKENPELTKASKTTLEHRGDISTGWSMAWKINWWARLLDGDRAHKILNKSFAFIEPENKENVVRNSSSGLYANLFSGRPFQIDANFGVPAGIVEMLMQSHQDTIRILPALPTAWETGAIEGLKSRGNFELNIYWKDGKFKEAELISHAGGVCSILFPENVQVVGFTGTGSGRYHRFSTEKGKSYKITCL